MHDKRECPMSSTISARNTTPQRTEEWRFETPLAEYPTARISFDTHTATDNAAVYQTALLLRRLLPWEIVLAILDLAELRILGSVSCAGHEWNRRDLVFAFGPLEFGGSGGSSSSRGANRRVRALGVEWDWSLASPGRSPFDMANTMRVRTGGVHPRMPWFWGLRHWSSTNPEVSGRVEGVEGTRRHRLWWRARPEAERRRYWMSGHGRVQSSGDMLLFGCKLQDHGGEDPVLLIAFAMS